MIPHAHVLSLRRQVKLKISMAMDFVIKGNTPQDLSEAFRNRDPWVRHEGTFRELYCVQRKQLKEVKEEMETKHDFPSAP
jgi:hypothetical protein